MAESYWRIHRAGVYNILNGGFGVAFLEKTVRVDGEEIGILTAGKIDADPNRPTLITLAIDVPPKKATWNPFGGRII